MAVKDKMYKEVQLWKSSGKSKADFILDRDYSKTKFEYWINRYNKEKVKPTKSSFKEIPTKSPIVVPEVKREKTLQIDLPKLPRDLAQLLVALGLQTYISVKKAHKNIIP